MTHITKEKIQSFIPKRKSNSYKGTYGHILFIGGNQNMGGAIILAASAAVYSGAGLVTVASHPTNQSALHARLPEAMFLSSNDPKAISDKISNMDIIVIGPGLGRDQQAQTLMRILYEKVTDEQIVVVDGDAINLHVNADLPEPKAKLIFTPHLGEWRTLTGLSPKEENEKTNQNHVDRLDSVVVLKKERTEVYIEKQVWKNTAGNPSMATGGMGDTLCGILASFLGQFQNKKHAILSAVFVHSHTADRLSDTHYVTLPSHLIEAFPGVIKDLVKADPIMRV